MVLALNVDMLFHLSEFKMNDEQRLAFLENLVRTRPSTHKALNAYDEVEDWFADLFAISETLEMFTKSRLQNAIERFLHQSKLKNFRTTDARFYNLIILQLKAECRRMRLDTVGPVSLSVGQGQVYDYFEAIREQIQLASKDILFVDPYINADFVKKYLPNVPAGVVVRLLGRKYMESLIPAVETFIKQSGIPISVRSSKDLHDRYLFIDGETCYQSGASFKDGADRTATTLTQITDAFDSVYETYQNLWNDGSIKLA